MFKPKVPLGELRSRVLSSTSSDEELVPISRLVRSDLPTWHRLWADYGLLGSMSLIVSLSKWEIDGCPKRSARPACMTVIHAIDSQEDREGIAAAELGSGSGTPDFANPPILRREIPRRINRLTGCVFSRELEPIHRCVDF